MNTHIECTMCWKEEPTMGLRWAMSYKFDEDADSYVLTNPDEEINQEQGQLEEQGMLSTSGRFGDDDLNDLDDDPSE